MRREHDGLFFLRFCWQSYKNVVPQKLAHEKFLIQDNILMLFWACSGLFYFLSYFNINFSKRDELHPLDWLWKEVTHSTIQDRKLHLPHIVQAHHDYRRGNSQGPRPPSCLFNNKTEKKPQLLFTSKVLLIIQGCMYERRMLVSISLSMVIK